VCARVLSQRVPAPLPHADGAGPDPCACPPTPTTRARWRRSHSCALCTQPLVSPSPSPPPLPSHPLLLPLLCSLAVPVRQTSPPPSCLRHCRRAGGHPALRIRPRPHPPPYPRPVALQRNGGVGPPVPSVSGGAGGVPDHAGRRHRGTGGTSRGGSGGAAVRLQRPQRARVSQGREGGVRLLHRAARRCRRAGGHARECSQGGGRGGIAAMCTVWRPRPHRDKCACAMRCRWRRLWRVFLRGTPPPATATGTCAAPWPACCGGRWTRTGQPPGQPPLPPQWPALLRGVVGLAGVGWRAAAGVLGAALRWGGERAVWIVMANLA